MEKTEKLKNELTDIVEELNPMHYLAREIIKAITESPTLAKIEDEDRLYDIMFLGIAKATCLLIERMQDFSMSEDFDMYDVYLNKHFKTARIFTELELKQDKDK